MAALKVTFKKNMLSAVKLIFKGDTPSFMVFLIWSLEAACVNERFSSAEFFL